MKNSILGFLSAGLISTNLMAATVGQQGSEVLVDSLKKQINNDTITLDIQLLPADDALLEREVTTINAKNVKLTAHKSRVLVFYSFVAINDIRGAPLAFNDAYAQDVVSVGQKLSLPRDTESAADIVGQVDIVCQSVKTAILPKAIDSCVVTLAE